MKIYLTPYLHEKKIYLNRQKLNTDYFYTSFETRIHQDMEDEDDLPVTSIIAFNMTESKMYAYS
jgi:hypothetical protein